MNFYTDESNNIRKERVINFIVYAPRGCGTDGGAFYLHSEINGSKTMDADTQLAYVIRRATIALDGQLFRMNSLSTDMYSTMRSLWKKLRASKELRHVFCSPCNSHGIQLFLKDILQLPWFKTVLSRVQQVVRAFRAAHKEYNLLREFQMDVYGKKIALILHCITRWGTQVGMLESVLKN